MRVFVGRGCSGGASGQPCGDDEKALGALLRLGRWWGVWVCASGDEASSGWRAQWAGRVGGGCGVGNGGVARGARADEGRAQSGRWATSGRVDMGGGAEGRRVPAQAGAAPQMWAGRQGRQGTAERRAGPAWERGEGYDACPGAGGAEGLTGRWSLWEGQGLSVLGRRASRRVPRACQWRRPRPGLGSACLPPLFPRSAPRRARGYARFLAAAPHPSTGQFLVRPRPCAGADACKAPDIRGGADAVAA